jgi:hypothetical protein
VKQALFDKDKGVCCSCGVDTEKLKARLGRIPVSVNIYEGRFWSDNVFDRARYNLACKIFLRRQDQLRKAIEKRRKKMFAAGWPTYACMKWWQMDHIMPFSEGGLTVIENVQTLCVLCHKKKTKLWHKERTILGKQKAKKATDLERDRKAEADKATWLAGGSEEASAETSVDLP